MLEFIVLGEIPGTSVRVTFTQVLVFSLIILLASELHLFANRKNVIRTTRNLINQISI